MSGSHQANVVYHYGDTRLRGYVAYPKELETPRPAVLVVHDWSGRNAFACQKADWLAELGYVAFAVDMYGEARVGETVDEKMALMQTVLPDRRLLRARLVAALECARGLEGVDERRIAVIGFCFGGLCALELARSGADIVGAASFHGLLAKADDVPNQPIKAKIIAFHGHDDPMVTPEQVNAFCREMTDAGVDWQVHQYGQTMHAFTNPEAHDKAMGTVYNANAARRSWQSLTNFLNEVFGEAI